MCLIVFAINHHPDYPLIMVANRDEFYERPTIPANYWTDKPQLLGGRDQQAGGTWMAFHKDGRMAAVTNYRDLKNLKSDAKSRGELPVNYLLGDHSAEQFLANVHKDSKAYNGFNMLVFETGNMYHYSNYEESINMVSPGIHGLSNALLDTPWPKVEKLKENFAAAISDVFTHEDLLQLLLNPTRANDELLPDTGVGYDLEKMLSAICIKSEKYGTSSSSVVTISKDGQVSFTERTHAVGGRKAGTVSYSWRQ